MSYNPSLTDTQLRASPVPVSGTVTANVGTIAGIATEATLSSLAAKFGSLGQKTMANSAPVVIASDQSAIPISGTVTANGGSGTFAISAAALPLPSGAATSAKQPALGTAGTASADVLTVQGIASMTALKVDGSAVTQPVSGTVTANAGSGTFAVSGPLTDAQLRASAVNVSDSGGSLTVDAPVATPVFVRLSDGAAAISTLPVSGPLTDTQLRASAVPVSGTVTANAGTGTFAVSGPLTDAQLRASAVPVSLTSTTVTGTVTVAGAAASGAAKAGNPVQIGGVFNTTAPTVTTGQAVEAQFTARGSQIVVLGDGTSTAAIKAASTAAAATDPALVVAVSPNNIIPSNITQINGVARLTGNGVTGTGSPRVTIASDNTPFTVNTTPTTPTASIINSAATTNATSIKASAGTLYSITVSNVGAAAVFVKLYNLTTAPTVGTSTIALTIPVPASGVVNIPFGSQGMRFGTGIALAITNLVADSDATAVAAGQVKVLTSYI